ncbi:reverse transcriptase family protein [Aeromonas sp.]|uniref:reverse transcriptase family protein n=1 Tax=Aeromonas sp. TaxID=647 RepID=UPI00258D8CD0|nr:reverse transcriptase family protein [Aeromonas sp.]
MMKRVSKHKSYPLNQSALFKINSPTKLAKILLVSDMSVLFKLQNKGEENYYFGTTGSGRDIEVPLSQLRRIHNRINKLLSHISVPDYLNSGVKERSNIKNAAAHVNAKKLLKIDITKYYQSITEEQVRKCFRKTFQCSPDVSSLLASLCCVRGHLPTGSTISQSLSFAVNRPVFDSINIYSNSKGVKFTCYVDDLTFSGDDIPSEFCDYIVGYIKKSRGYKCHKIRRYNSETDKPVTGVIISNGHLKVMNRHVKVINSLYKSMNKMTARFSSTDKELIHYFQVLQGHLFSAGQINPRYKRLGWHVVDIRKELSVPALNQNTM